MTNRAPEEPTFDQLARALDDGAILLDVREPAEFTAGHVPGARSVPLATLPDHLVDLDRTRDIYVICASGNRSRVGVDLLAAAGVRAANVEGGTSGWLEAGRPLATGSAA